MGADALGTELAVGRGNYVSIALQQEEEEEAGMMTERGRDRV